MWAIKCDRCGAYDDKPVFQDGDALATVVQIISKLRYDPQGSTLEEYGSAWQRIDFCAPCLQSLARWFEKPPMPKKPEGHHPAYEQPMKEPKDKGGWL